MVQFPHYKEEDMKVQVIKPSNKIEQVTKKGSRSLVLNPFSSCNTTPPPEAAPELLPLT